MKRFLLSVCLCLGLCAGGRAQVASEDAISYQAIARDASGQIIAERPIGVKVEILQGSTEGAAIYSETHEATTSPTGVVNLSIGNGTEPSGAFSDIDWGASTYFLRLSMDTEGGKDYKEVATTQIMPVPYALYAKEAGQVKNEIPRYIITSPEEDIYKFLASGEIMEHKEGITDGYAYYVDIEFMLTYLDRTNQELTAEVSGFSSDIELDVEDSQNYSTESSEFGRYVFLRYISKTNQSMGGETGTLLIKDKNGNILEERPIHVLSYPW